MANDPDHQYFPLVSDLRPNPIRRYPVLQVIDLLVSAVLIIPFALVVALIVLQP